MSNENATLQSYEDDTGGNFPSHNKMEVWNKREGWKICWIIKHEVDGTLHFKLEAE